MNDDTNQITPALTGPDLAIARFMEPWTEESATTWHHKLLHVLRVLPFPILLMIVMWRSPHNDIMPAFLFNAIYGILMFFIFALALSDLRNESKHHTKTGYAQLSWYLRNAAIMGISSFFMALVILFANNSDTKVFVIGVILFIILAITAIIFSLVSLFMVTEAEKRLYRNR